MCLTRETCAEQTPDALAAAAEEVLETMFFTTIEGRLDLWPDPAEAVTATLPFFGELSGLFRLDVSLASARRIAAAFLAAEPEALPPDRIGEVVCELANMICGCTLSKLRGKSVFELLMPHLESDPDSTAEPSLSHVFQLEDGLLRVSLQVE
jgi:CheY-specific phosphatase CheX